MVSRVKEAGGAMGLFNFHRAQSRPFELTLAMASWRAYEKVKDDESLRRLAEQDLRDSHAMAIHNTVGELTGFIDGCAAVWDNGLFNLVALLYLSRCLRDDRDCWKPLGASIPDRHLAGFATFGLDLANCQARKASRILSTISTVTMILYSWYFRLPYAQHILAEGKQILDHMLHSDYVFALPPHDEGPARSQLLCSIQDRALRDEITSIYHNSKLENQWDARRYTERITEEYVFEMHHSTKLPYVLEEWCRFGLLTVGQGLELVHAVENSKLVEDLIARRPPNSLASHFSTMVDCAEHARLLLAGSELPVYYTFPELNYFNLLAAARQDGCVEALESSLGFAARGPSPIEKILRQLALETIASGEFRRIEAARSFLTAPPGMGFGKLNSVPVVLKDPRDSVTCSRFAKTVNVFRTIATCEPSVEKLSYLVGRQAAEEYHSTFVDVARDTKVINWPALLDAAPGDSIVYDRWNWDDDQDDQGRQYLGIDATDLGP